jgi:hypothetical protein
VEMLRLPPAALAAAAADVTALASANARLDVSELPDEIRIQTYSF